MLLSGRLCGCYLRGRAPNQFPLLSLLPGSVFYNKQRRSLSSRNRASTSTFSEEGCAADLIGWPDGLRPNSGRVTKTALGKLKIEHLSDELTKRNLSPKGKKADLIQQLLKVVELEWEGRSGPQNGLQEALLQEAAEEVPDNVVESTEQSGTIQEPIATASSSGQTDRKPFSMTLLNHETLDHDIWIGGSEIGEKLIHQQLLDWMLLNTSGMQLVFLGTSAVYPIPGRGLPSMALRTQSDIWLFDVGEDSQRQVLKHPGIRAGKITRIFLTGLSADLLFGLPGMLCTISYARESGHSNADIPVHIYGPPGITEYISAAMELSDTYLETPVIIHEFVMKPVGDEEWMERVTRRAKLWSVWIPPDGLSEDGWYDADLKANMPMKRKPSKRIRRQSTSLTDSRAVFRPMKLPEPGDPSKKRLGPRECTWTLRINDEFKVTAFPLKSKIPSMGYTIQESDRAGKLDVDRAKQLRVQEGKDYGHLKQGVEVISTTGLLVQPNMVVSPDRPGRKVVILGDTPQPDTAEAHVRHADVLTIGAQLSVEESGESTNDDAGSGVKLGAEEAVKFGRQMGVQQTLISRLELTGASTDVPEDMEGIIVNDESPTLAVGAFDLYTHVLDNRKSPPLPPLPPEVLDSLESNVETGQEEAEQDGD